MRKTIWESREAGGRRKEERWGLAAAFLAATRTSGNRSGGDEGAAAHGGSCLPLNRGGGEIWVSICGHYYSVADKLVYCTETWLYMVL
jgi:hypothetical protein